MLKAEGCFIVEQDPEHRAQRQREFEYACQKATKPIMDIVRQFEETGVTWRFRVARDGVVQWHQSRTDELISLQSKAHDLYQSICQMILATEFRDLLPLPKDGPKGIGPIDS